MKTICIIGLWHLGLVNCVGFAEAGYRVIGVDFNEDTILKLSLGDPPIFEPGLTELINKHLSSGQLGFSTNISNVTDADWVMIAYDSPVNENDEVDITPITNAAQLIINHIGLETPLIITSQVPVGTCNHLDLSLKLVSPAWKGGVVYTPENLRLGSAIERFKNPDMIVLGADSQLALDQALDLYAPFTTEKPTMGLRSAEMVKHALNTFLATSITFINEIANLSDRLGADAVAVGKALKLDQRIGKKALLSPGLGFSGGTLARDVKQLKKFGEEVDYQTKLIDAIIDINEYSFDEVIVKLTEALEGSLKDKKIGLMGLTYKPDTSTMRRSPAIKIMQKLNKCGAVCVGYDLRADDKEVEEYQNLFTRVHTLQDLARDADALVLVNECKEFKVIDFAALGKLMNNKVLIDTKNFLYDQNLSGYYYQGFGRK